MDAKDNLHRLLRIQELALGIAQANRIVERAPERIEEIENRFRERNAEYVAIKERHDALDQDQRLRSGELERLADKARDEIASIAEARQDRLSLLRSVTEQDDLRRLAARERSSARRELAGMIRRLAPKGAQSARFSVNKGRLGWPAVGKVDVGFGQRVEDAYGTVTSHNGLDIRAPPGSHVQAIAAGKVVHAGWLKGYGRLLILDHGEHYHSLMAHLASIAVAAGDDVKQGQEVGTVGDTGSLRGTVLYFEIRHEGIPVNPGPVQEPRAPTGSLHSGWPHTLRPRSPSWSDDRASVGS